MSHLTWCYSKHEVWAENAPLLVFILDHPRSSVTALNDTQMMVCREIAQHHVYGGMVLLYLNPQVDTRTMLAGYPEPPDHILRANDVVLMREVFDRDVICCWASMDTHDRGAEVLEKIQMFCAGTYSLEPGYAIPPGWVDTYVEWYDYPA